MKAVVTGASGFLGSRLCAELLREGHQVVAGSRKPVPELIALGARHAPLDLSDRDALRNAFKDADVVFHVAAKTGVWGREREYVESNVTGTRNVLAACEQRRVKRLVYTSSPSVVFDGRDHVDASNDLPYAHDYLCSYPATKALAEREVLAANGRWGLSTCALRPHLIFGPGDPHLVPRLLARARAGKLARIGTGDNEVTLCAVETAVAAHIAAARGLRPDARHAGRAYFIGQERPVRLWDWIDGLLRALDIPPVQRRVPFALAYATGTLCEAIWWLTARASEPPMTRFVALALARSHSYSMEPAKCDFGFREPLGIEAATAAVVASLRS
ncbi:MAG: NAD-dependent epimerase/dehydratase family protein [Planctomycetes bacterium]|nr:NAD-dependent epimerase/dehydratase family protein [Planctomycetota bacterium]